MSIDAYSICPGGTGKKIKFCCNDFLPELQKLDRMLEGEQYLACLQQVDRLLAQEPGRDRQCLLATKCLLLRLTEQYDALRMTVRAFAEKYPDNQIALAEQAMLAAHNDGRAALGYLQEATRIAAGAIDSRVYQAMGVAVIALLRDGLPRPARALLEFQAAAVEDDPRPEELLSRLEHAADIPLLLRDHISIAPCSENAPYHDRFDHAHEAIDLGDFKTGAEQLAALAAECSAEPAVWRNLATVRGWLADNAGAIEALHKYAALRAADDDGPEDAVDAEAEAMFLSDDPLGDQQELLRLVWTVRDVDRAQEALLSSPRLRSIGFDPSQMSDGETPPPKAAYMLLDRPMPSSADGLTFETLPRLVGQGLLFGRQTDREARLEIIGVANDDAAAVDDMIRGALGDAADADPRRDVVAHVLTTKLLLRPLWQPPQSVDPEQLRALIEEYQRRAILELWPDLKLGVLDGRSPREAAGDPSYRLRVSAAIVVLEHFAEPQPKSFDFNELRAQLGLPLLGPIGPAQHPLSDVPIQRLPRLNVASLSDEDLIAAYYRAGAFSMREATRRFAEAIVARPTLADSDHRPLALGTLARTAEDYGAAREYIEQGRHVAEARKQSHAWLDLLELRIAFAAADGRNAMRLVQHIQRNHSQEPRVAEQLMRILVDVGLLNPDGTPAIAPQAAGATQEPLEEPATAPSGLWTPDSAQPTAAGKLWTPD